MTLPDIEAVLTHFDRVTKTGGGWRALCPAHGDRHPSLDIAIGRGGRILFDCKSHHCDVASICAAAGLKMRDLFPQEEGRGGSYRRTQPARKPLEANWVKIARAAQLQTPDDVALNRKERALAKKVLALCDGQSIEVLDKVLAAVIAGYKIANGDGAAKAGKAVTK